MKGFTSEDEDGAVEQRGQSVDGKAVTEVRAGALICQWTEVMGLKGHTYRVVNSIISINCCCCSNH